MFLKAAIKENLLKIAVPNNDSHDNISYSLDTHSWQFLCSNTGEMEFSLSVPDSFIQCIQEICLKTKLTNILYAWVTQTKHCWTPNKPMTSFLYSCHPRF